MLDSLAPARRRLLLGGTAVLAAAVLAGVAALVLGSRPVQPAPQGRPGPVLLVSGYGGGTDRLAVLAQALERTGRTAVVVPALGGGTGDLEEQAQALDRVARRVVADSGAPSVDVVGYSAGGVVARLWVDRHGGAGLARRVLTVGSPHHGTDLAGVAVDVVGECPEACRQLSPDSALLASLNRDETPDGPVFVSVWTERDRIVVPPDSSALEGALSFSVQSVCPAADSGHGDLPGDPVVLAALDTVLAADPPRVPGPEVCD